MTLVADQEVQAVSPATSHVVSKPQAEVPAVSTVSVRKTLLYTSGVISFGNQEQALLDRYLQALSARKKTSEIREEIHELAHSNEPVDTDLLGVAEVIQRAVRQPEHVLTFRVGIDGVLTVVGRQMNAARVENIVHHLIAAELPIGRPVSKSVVTGTIVATNARRALEDGFEQLRAMLGALHGDMTNGYVTTSCFDLIDAGVEAVVVFDIKP